MRAAAMASLCFGALKLLATHGKRERVQLTLCSRHRTNMPPSVATVV